MGRLWGCLVTSVGPYLPGMEKQARELVGQLQAEAPMVRRMGELMLVMAQAIDYLRAEVDDLKANRG